MNQENEQNNYNNVNLNDINYYSVEDPEQDELVLATFTENNDVFFGKLEQYQGYSCMMNYQDIVKKRKITSWTKYVPLNKTMIVKVEDVDTEKKIVQTSIVYLGEHFKEQLTTQQIQEKLMEQFNENNHMENFIKSFCISHNYDIKDIWTTLIYHIDQLRRDNDEDSIPSLWKYFTDNIDDLDEWISECELDEIIGTEMRELYNKKNKESPKRIVSKFGIISSGGINLTKDLLTKILKDITFEYTLKYTTPYYLFESSSENSTQKNHEKFIKMIEQEANKIEPKVFIKQDFIAKISTN